MSCCLNPSCIVLGRIAYVHSLLDPPCHFPGHRKRIGPRSREGCHKTRSDLRSYVRQGLLLAGRYRRSRKAGIFFTPVRPDCWYVRYLFPNYYIRLIYLTAYSHITGSNDYPHQYNNREGFDFPGQAPYYEFPILSSFDPYDGGSPGADRVVFNEGGDYQGAITHTGASGNNFVECT